MGIINNIKNLFKNDTQSINTGSVTVDDVLLQALINGETITREKAMTLPAVSSAVDFISSSIACMPVKLYKYKQGKITEVEKDTRVAILNGDTGDTLDAYQLKKAMVEDYLMGKGGYALTRWNNMNQLTGLFYVKDIDVTIYKNVDPIYKYVTFLIGTNYYKNYQLVKLLRNTKDGASGVGLTKEISKVLETAYSTLVYQLGLVKSGGNKKGFLQSERKLGTDEMTALKEAWRNLYQNNTENVMVLNNGIKFQDSSNSSVEMQLNESKKTLNDDINNVFHISTDFDLTFKKAVYPIVKALETALNSTLLLETEKRYMFFECDVKEIVKANIKDRYEAHKIAIEKGWATINEVRKAENMNYLEGLDVLNFSLGSVLYDVNTHTYYTPNTGEVRENITTTEENEIKENGEVVEQNNSEGGENNA